MPADEPSFTVRSSDGTPIAVFSSGKGPPILLVHGSTADHTTFRVVGPMLASTFRVHAMDRRGRGASGDGPTYAVEREFEDVAAVAEAIAAGRGGPIPVVGHSFGGRVALGAALGAAAIDRLVVYESAPAPAGTSYQPPGVPDRLRRLVADGDFDGTLATFMTEVVGMAPGELAAFRADPIWPRRAAAAPTIIRELEAEADPAAGLDRLGRLSRPVLQLLGGASPPVFGAATRALAERLGNGRVVVLPGHRHAAHHTAPQAFVAVVRAFGLP